MTGSLFDDEKTSIDRRQNAAAQILFPVALPAPFDYEIPPGLELKRGDFVYAPIGRQMKLGVVWGVSPPSTDKKLKPVTERINVRGLSSEMLEFVEFTANYNCAWLGAVLRMVIRSHKALLPSKMAVLYEKSGPGSDGAISAPRRRVLSLGDEHFPGQAAALAKAAKVSPGVIKTMTSAGLLLSKRAPVDPPFCLPNTEPAEMAARRKFALTAQQVEAGKELSAMVEASRFETALIDGVTGSGKTEVYLQAAARALARGGQVLILVPEIALTQAGLKRFEQAFDARPAQWHSAMGDAERRRTWREVHRGRARLVVGARSALYLPFTDLQLIVVDEEHDGSYKQEEGVIYNARDMAIMRGKFAGCAVVLASATPALESLSNARSGRYRHIKLPGRPGAATMPDVGIVDLREDIPAKGDFLSPPLIEGAQAALERGEQAMLYLNRRGYAPLIICAACGEKLKSPDTDSWLVLHRRSGRAMCHLTGFSMPLPKECPSCRKEDSLKPYGPGVERIAEEAKRHFPDAKIEVLSSDTAGNPEQIRARMAAMADGEIDIMVGTQMVVKGHNFPLLTFVGVVDGDLGLMGGDMRAGERTYQTLVQVSGRAGRAAFPGTALIQTHMPRHEALAALAAGRRDDFIVAELAMRELLSLPPFGRLAAIIISAPTPMNADQFAQTVLSAAPRAPAIEILGPAEAPIAMLRGRHRRRFLIKSPKNFNMPAYMANWRARLKIPNKVKLQIDIDPMSFV